MKISERNALFGEEFGLVLTGKKTSSIDEEEIAKNIYAITDLTKRIQVFTKYIHTLHTQIADPTNDHFALADRLLLNLSKQANVKSDTHTQLQIKEILATAKKHRGLNHEFFIDNFNLTMALSNRTDLGLYPKATCAISKIHLLQEENLISTFDQIRNDYKLNKKYCELYIKNKQCSKNYHAYPFNRLGTLDASLITYDNATPFILSACPEETQIDEHFQKCILETNCSLWFSLNEETRRPKFWSNKYLEKLKLPDWKVTNISEKDSSKNSNLLKSELKATNSSESRTITHIHFTNWKDNKAAPNDSDLLTCAIQACQHIESGKIVGINCMEGIGRSGTLAVLTICLLSIRKLQSKSVPLQKITINVAEVTYQLRMQRTSIVGTEEQYIQIHRILAQDYKVFF